MRNIFKAKTGLLCLFLLFPVLSFAQSITISGTVTDERGETLPGVSIFVPGANIGTISDIDGNYRLDVPGGGKLTFSYVGYLPQTVDVNGRKIINITLQEDTKALDEVVVIGYGTMKRSDLTGAVSSINSEAILKSVTTTLDQVLQGRAAGVQVTQTSGMPGAAASVKIRGTASLNLTTEPLYVIDGVAIQGASGITNPLASINPQDIVSMDILKDASAAAIYGSRGANGVIMITTKRGQAGEAKITYNGYMGWQEIPSRLDVLNLRQYAEHRNVLAENGLINYNNSFVRPDLLSEGANWQEELFNQAFMNNHNLSISGGTDKSTYNIGAGYSNQEGIAVGSGFQRYNLSGNVDSQVKPWAKAGVTFNLSNTFQQLTNNDQNLVQVAIRSTPDVPAQNADGTFSAADEQFMPTNPMAMAKLIKNSVERLGIRGNGYLELTPKGILDGLTFRTELGFDFNFANSDRFQPTYRLSQTQFNENNTRRVEKQYNKFWNWANTLTYNKTFNTVHRLTAMAGMEFSKSYWSNVWGLRQGFPTNDYPDLTLGDATTAATDGQSGNFPMVSSFGRLFYSYDDTYLFTATIRRDGSSNFSPGKYWSLFPSVALAWRASKYLENVPEISNLKFRLGYGGMGNQNIDSDHFSYLMKYGVQTTPWGTGLYALNMFDENVTWETTNMFNAGFDLSILNNRIDIVFDWYNKTTKDLLMQRIVPTYIQAGRNLAWSNIGSLRNTGVEFTINSLNINKRDFKWHTSINFSLNRNKVLEMGDNSDSEYSMYGRVDDNAWGMTGQTIINRTIVGRPIGEFYGYQVIGRFEKATDFYHIDKNGNVARTAVTTLSDGSLLPINETSGVWIGDYIYKDRNGDGKIDEQDRTIIGNPEPKFTYGINNSFTYKDFDLGIQLTGVYGNDVVNYVSRYMNNPRRNISNLFVSALDYAKIDLIDPNGPNDYRNVQIVGGDPHAPRLPLSTATSDYDFAFSDRFIEDGSYLRIQNVSLGYTLPRNLLKKVAVDNVRIYINLQNLYTFSKYKGYDPEIGERSGYNGSKLISVDNGRYPSPRIYTFGLNVTF
ncbi:MAG: TonB-dependent receptor [Dysgonamonadaceae bacterium]|jgi:TonB-linked SusC/RagA family outer membrane protein|nr:TonB-dependent receptor [Dysgonamonadaceae bacterium]